MDNTKVSKDSSILKLELKTFYGEILNKVAEERKEEKEGEERV